MKFLILTLSFFLFANDSTFIEKKDFSGYIFNENHFVFISIDDQQKRYTPTTEDIVSAEQILKKEISCANKKRINQIDNYPVIDKKLKKYTRQYVGFINKSDEKIIWINFLWKGKFSKDECLKDVIRVHDGGSYYWNVKINLKTKSLYELDVNGHG